MSPAQGKRPAACSWWITCAELAAEGAAMAAPCDGCPASTKLAEPVVVRGA